jgi:hypothetical protein
MSKAFDSFVMAVLELGALFLFILATILVLS